jgi:tellurite resistance protein
MAWERLEGLRDRLLNAGRRSLVPRPVDADPETDAMLLRLRPFAEAMFLVVASDHVLDDAERAALRGALRTLTEDRLGTAALDALLSELQRTLEHSDAETRLDAVAAELYGDREDAELAISLAVAAALASEQVDAEERGIVAGLAERLGISSQRLAELEHQGG